MKFRSYLWSLLALIAMSVATIGCSDDDDDVVTPPAPSELTFALEINNVTAHGADMQITPSDMTKTYFADVAPAKMFETATDEAIIEMIGKMVKPEDLLKGVQKVTPGKELDAETEYTLFAVGYANNNATSKVFKKTFKTLAEGGENPEPQNPALKLSSMSQEVASEGGEFSFTATVKNASEDVYVEANCDAEWIKNIKVQESRADLTATISFTVAANEGKAREAKIGVFYGDEETAFTVKQAANAGAEVKNPEVEVNAYFDEAQKAIVVESKCTSKDASSAKGLFIDAAQIDAIIAQGATLEAIMNDNGNPFAPQLLTALNSDEGLQMPFGIAEGLKPNVMMAWIVDVRNAGDGRTIKRADAMFEAAEATAPEVTVEASYSAEENKILVTMKCLSQDAASTFVFAGNADEIDKILGENPGATIEDIFEANKQSVSLAEVINAPEGYTLAFGVDEGLTTGMNFFFGLEVLTAEGGRTFKNVRAQFGEASTGAPVIEVIGTCNLETSNLDFKLICTSRDAEEARHIMCDKTQIDALGDITMAQLFETQGFYPISDNSYIRDINGKGIVYGWGGTIGQTISCVFEASNAYGKSYARADVEVKGFNPDGGGVVEATIEGRFNAMSKQLIYTTKCTSKNAAIAEMFIMATEKLESALTHGDTIEQIVDAVADRVNEEGIAALNSDEGFTCKYDGLHDTQTYSFVINIKSLDGGVTLKRADVLFGSERPTHTGDMKMRFWAGAGNGLGHEYDTQLWWNAFCETKNVDEAWVYPADPADVKENMTNDEYQALLDANMKDVDKCGLIDIDDINNKGGKHYIDVLPSTTRAFILKVSNADCVKFYRADATSYAQGEKPEQGKGPQIEYRVHLALDSKGGKMCAAYIQCVNKDATYASWIMSPKVMVDDMLNGGLTMEDIMDPMFQMAVSLNSQKAWWDKFISGEVLILTADTVPELETAYGPEYATIIYAVSDAGYTVKRADFSSEDEPQEIEYPEEPKPASFNYTEMKAYGEWMLKDAKMHRTFQPEQFNVTYEYGVAEPNANVTFLGAVASEESNGIQLMDVHYSPLKVSKVAGRANVVAASAQGAKVLPGYFL